jgi:hypothetical protein
MIGIVHQLLVGLNFRLSCVTPQWLINTARIIASTMPAQIGRLL